MGLFTQLQEHLKKDKTPLISEERILEALRVVIDPDLHRDIVSLGFVKQVRIAQGDVTVDVELTTPACPVKDLLKKQSEDAIRTISGVTNVTVKISAETRGSKITAPNISQALGQVRNIIAVAAGKGGVGKSTTAVNLAYALSQSGSRVGILDADVYGPSIPTMIKSGMPTEQQGTMVVPPVVKGVKAISVAMFSSAKNAAMLRGPMAAQIIKQFLSQVAWGELDYLIIDYPPGTGDIQLTISQIAPVTAAVVVTTPQDVALIDVRKAVNMFETLKVPVLGVIETMSYFICDGCDKKHFIFRQDGGERLSKELGLPLLGQIPLDANVAPAADEGRPIVSEETKSVAAKAYIAAAGETARHLSIINSNNAGALQQFSIVWQN